MLFTKYKIPDTYKEYVTKHVKAFSLIFLMLGTSFFVKSREIILPEMAALSIGSFIYLKDDWRRKPLHLFYLPSITAIIGFGINMLDISMVMKLIISLILVLAVLKIAENFLAPAIATGLLPIITNCSSWEFLASIFFFTFILGFSIFINKKNNPVNSINKSSAGKSIHLFTYLFITIVWFIICDMYEHMEMAAIPPIIVIAFENMTKTSYTITTLVTQIVAMSIASMIGFYCYNFFNQHIIISGAASFTLITLVLYTLKVKLPPAYAMAILPMILDRQTPVYFTTRTLIMSLTLFTLIYISKRLIENYSTHQK
ncbi:HPP family protein [Chryseobacterium pennipullorum]|uniref:HPP family protein n=1 Tax=Chryseobacterium pennipullorum TaxID=2258963 RepID=A0A3D9B1Y1_9FLAO|nr:HPP family protein [Chryseobacterium pennipullorum]REC47529.1 hypothetical protein DRF67_10835 [Chryseobacterium pennipullorum]